MLTAYRRHLKNCRRRDEGRSYRNCRCPIWVDGILGGAEIRESLKVRDWQRAQEIIREWEIENRRTSQLTRKSTQEAWKEFLADIEARKLNDSTARKYKLLNRQMEEFAQRRGLRVLADFDLSKVSQFRSEWKDGPRSSAKKLERLRAFFRFAQKRKWVAENPALDLKAPKISLCPTLPFSREEMVLILAATDQYKEEMPSHGIENGRRIRGLVLLLRYSGMRIRSERLRAFFRFAQKRKWVAENPALDLKAPKISLCPTLPFSREEMVLILAATDQYKEEMPSHGIENGRRIRGLVLLLRYSGMRI